MKLNNDLERFYRDVRGSAFQTYTNPSKGFLKE